ncbi:MAG: hypothetical protein ABF743_01080 [Schleiferilactobacillus perolens]|uniref:hypothetical protein n=1 Tax=Schleiferilactobacillus perolens TaxID=100468 RepID=UPI0039EBC43F
MKQSEADKTMPVISTEEFLSLFSRDELFDMAREMGLVSDDESSTIVEAPDSENYSTRSFSPYGTVQSEDTHFDDSDYAQEVLAA